MGGSLGLSGPNQQATDRMSPIQRIEQAADLIAVPNITALKLRQRHMATVDMVEDSGNFHTSRLLPVSSCCIMHGTSYGTLCALDSGHFRNIGFVPILCPDYFKIQYKRRD